MPSVVSEEAAELSAGFGQLLDGRLRAAAVGDEYFAADHRPLWDAIASGGWLDLAVPERDGGAGLPLRDLTAVAQAWGRHLIPLPFTPTLLLRALPQVRNSVAAADPLSLAVPAPRRGLLVPMPAAAGLRYVGFQEDRVAPALIALPGDLSTDEFAPSLPIGAGHVQRAAGGGADLLAGAAVLWAAEATGAAAAAFQIAFDYAGVRHAFGRRIAEFQAVKHRVADMYTSLELARTAVLWGANSVPDSGPGIRLAVELSRDVIEGAIQVMGGMGFTWEAGIHFFLRHVLAIERLTRFTRPGAD
jgi:alkylation response protein AidB-like acyl-CoA dehydrogenase